MKKSKTLAELTEKTLQYRRRVVFVIPWMHTEESVGDVSGNTPVLIAD